MDSSVQPPLKHVRAGNSTPVCLVFVGDVMLSRNVGDRISRNGAEFPFEHVQTLLRQGDISMANLESPLSDRNGTVCQKNTTVCFKASPETIEGLTYADFDIMTVANNHALDHGPLVMNDTLYHLSAAGIQCCGAQQGAEDTVQEAVILHVPGMKIAFLGFDDINNGSRYRASNYPRPWDASEKAVILAVNQARTAADIVVVNFHFGEEYNFTHTTRQEQLSHAAADAGAAVIIGHHPHVIQDVERYNSSVIAYRLGNFVFDQEGKGVREGAVLTVQIDPVSKQIVGHSLEKVTVNGEYQPRPGLLGSGISWYERAVSWSSSKISSFS